MRQIQEKSFGRRCLETLIEVATPILAVLSPGCVENYTVTPQLGVNVPIEKNPDLPFDSAFKYGTAVGLKTRDGTEWELGIDFFQSTGRNVAQVTTSDISTLTLGARIPVFKRNGTSLFVTPQVCSFSETARTELIALPGMGYTEKNGSLGYGVEIGARFKLKRNGVEDEKQADINVGAKFRKYSGGVSRDSDFELEAGVVFKF
jgi:hypothetical protein